MNLHLRRCGANGGFEHAQEMAGFCRMGSEKPTDLVVEVNRERPARRGPSWNAGVFSLGVWLWPRAAYWGGHRALLAGWKRYRTLATSFKDSTA